MNKVVVKSLIGQNVESLGAYVDYSDFCKMQREYEEQIEKMKCCENCTHSTLNECDNLVCELNQFKFPEDYPCINYSKWKLAE